ncbi:hypothetical protein SKAU_G00297480 [Synaphobranchus kaupii]|uniref:Transmembrane protein 100 n=1 Tax=Synaphobranchus kaupii TaxID=118154 RepID=A0A9Q1EV06_SYNKA|nr:hypothetical protein SKAU_G00297480 [Synaphobranchus kaupii]
MVINMGWVGCSWVCENSQKNGEHKRKIQSHEPISPTKGVATQTEVQLLAATGGAELSCYRCTVPFGVVVLIAGVVVTAVAYTFNTHGSTISVLGLVLLSAGLLLLAASVACWKVRRERQRERRRESQAALVATRGSVFV